MVLAGGGLELGGLELGGRLGDKTGPPSPPDPELVEVWDQNVLGLGPGPHGLGAPRTGRGGAPPGAAVGIQIWAALGADPPVHGQPAQLLETDGVIVELARRIGHDHKIPCVFN